MIPTAVPKQGMMNKIPANVPIDNPASIPEIINPMEYKISSKNINSKSKFNIYLAPGGGFAIEIVKK